VKNRSETDSKDKQDMKKVILSMAVAALAVTLRAGETNQSPKAATGDKPKAECPASGGCCAKQEAKGCCPAAGAKAADAAKPAPKADK
jgi:hypothetical protein